MEAFDRFVLEQKASLRRIAGHTRGEYTYEDVVNEAWLMVETVASRRQVPVDLLSPAFQDLLLSHLYQHLVRYSERNVRHAIRLDHGSDDDDRDSRHPLLNLLVSDEGNDPLSHLIAAEERRMSWSSANELHSLASAYLELLENFSYRMRSVANYLLISTSHAYRCCGKARLFTTYQQALALEPPANAIRLKPWRRYRIVRIPRQMEFDFEERLPLAVHQELAQAPAY